MPITTNKPVNFISFSIVLLVIMGICLCISPNTAYAVDQEPSLPPANAFVPALQLAIPEPPTGDGQAWVAISNGTQARVIMLSARSEGTLTDYEFTPGYVIEDVNSSAKQISVNFGGQLSSVYSLVVYRWDSDSTLYSLIDEVSGSSSRTAVIPTGFTPTYIAFGGNIGFADSVTIKSFVPIFSDNGYNENLDILNGMLDIEADVEASAASLVKLRENLALVVRDVDDIRVESEEANASLIALRENLALVVRDVDDLRLEAVSLHTDVNEGLTAIRSNLGLITRDVDDIRVESVEINENLGVLLADTSQLNVQFTSFRSDFSLLASDVSDILTSLEGLSADFDSLSSSMNSLKDSFDELLNHFSTLSDEMASLTAAIEAETEIWENSKTEYKYDQVDDYSVSAFADLWDWLINPFMSLFESLDGEISYDVESLDPGSLVTLQLSVGQYFQDVMFNPDAVNPFYSDLGDINIGGLP